MEKMEYLGGYQIHKKMDARIENYLQSEEIR